MKRKNPSSGPSLARAVAMLGLAMGAVVPMAGCSTETDGAEATAAPTAESSAKSADEGGASNPCAVKKKKKTGPCSVGG
jgi:hypothetical protein